MIGPAALFIGTTENDLRKMSNRGLIPHSRIGKVRVYLDEHRDEIRRILAEHGRLGERPAAPELAHAAQ